jgi:hypothetical protein
MTIDTILKSVKVDTVKGDVIDLANNITNGQTTTFEYKKTLIVALIGAVIGQCLVILIAWIKSKIDLRAKKRLLIADLKNQKQIIGRLHKSLMALLGKFEQRNTNNHSYDAFYDLQIDIYSSIAKTDLFKIFGKRFSKIVKIYKTLDFLGTYSIDRIYKEYLTKIDRHTQEKRDDPKHDFYCASHLGFIELAKSQIKNNIQTIEELTKEIDEFI